MYICTFSIELLLDACGTVILQIFKHLLLFSTIVLFMYKLIYFYIYNFTDIILPIKIFIPFVLYSFMIQDVHMEVPVKLYISVTNVNTGYFFSITTFLP